MSLLRTVSLRGELEVGRKCAEYHRKDPIIFHGLKSLTLANSQQKSLLRCAAAGISVRNYITMYADFADMAA